MDFLSQHSNKEVPSRTVRIKKQYCCAVNNYIVQRLAGHWGS